MTTIPTTYPFVWNEPFLVTIRFIVFDVTKGMMELEAICLFNSYRERLLSMRFDWGIDFEVLWSFQCHAEDKTISNS